MINGCLVHVRFLEFAEFVITRHGRPLVIGASRGPGDVPGGPAVGGNKIGSIKVVRTLKLGIRVLLLLDQ